MPLPEPTRRVWGHYDVEQTIGRGAMGMVYLARDRRIGRKVALKTVQVDQILDDESSAGEFYKRLQREAELSGSLQHPNIVTLYEAGYENDQIAYLATEFIDGESLKDRLKKSKPLPLGFALSIGADILRGLAFAHARGIVHRDIKPANILLTKEGQAKIADFGIARPTDSTLTSAGALLGTPNYMSPEQVKAAPVTPKSDLFSVGVVMYEMLTGAKPFAADDLSGILQRVLHHDPTFASQVNPVVPPEVAQIVQKLLAKSPDGRYASAEAALDDLRKLQQSGKVEELGSISIVGADSATMQASEWSAPTIGTKTETFFTRRVSAPVAWSILLLLTGSVAAALVMNEMESRRPAGAVITPQQLAEFSAKRNALAAARQLLDARRYDESIRAFDDYLALYPQSITARAGREEALRQREEPKSRRARSTVTVRARPPAPKKVEAAEPEKRVSRWQRIRRWFRGSPAAPPAQSSTSPR